ncbi:hypothetical protein AB0D71_30305 [Streptomyces avermitilis]
MTPVDIDGWDNRTYRPGSDTAAKGRGGTFGVGPTIGGWQNGSAWRTG